MERLDEFVVKVLEGRVIGGAGAKDALGTDPIWTESLTASARSKLTYRESERLGEKVE